MPCERPEKLYTTYLENKYKLFVGTPKWAKLEKKDEVDEDLDSDILKVFVSLNSSSVQWIENLILFLPYLAQLPFGGAESKESTEKYH